MQVKTTFLLLYWVLCSRLSAQLNESDTLLLQYNTALAGSLQTGNVEAVAVRLKADFSFAPTSLWAFKTQNTYRYQEFYTRKADNDFSGRNFFYLWQRHQVYPFAMVFISTNYRRKIDFRYFTGAGATWQVVRTPRHTVKVALSGVYESTRFAGDTYNYAEYNGSENIDTWCASAWLMGKHTLVDNRLRLYYEAFVQPSLEQNGNFRWQTEIGLEWPVWKGFSGTINYIFTHENVVVSTVKADDRLLTFGIAYIGKIKLIP